MRGRERESEVEKEKVNAVHMRVSEKRVRDTKVLQ